MASTTDARPTACSTRRVPDRIRALAADQLTACAADLSRSWDGHSVPADGALAVLLGALGEDTGWDASTCLEQAGALVAELSIRAAAKGAVARWRPISQARRDAETLITDDNADDGADFAVCRWHENEYWKGWVYDDDLMNDARPEGPAPSLFLDIPPLPMERPAPHYGTHLREIDDSNTGQ